MSKNEEKERKNSKGQKKDNKLTKGNRTSENDNKSPLREEGKSDDISNAFPNFSALTEDERLAFFQALTTARKNVEKRGVLTRQRFGTVHDEYLKYFNQDEEEGKKNFCISANAKDIPSLKSSLTIHDGNASSCSDQSTLKLYNRNPSDGEPRLPTPLFVETPHKDLFPVTKDKGSWDQCESVIKQNTSQMVDIYLRKKKRNEAKSDGVQLVNKKLEKNIKKEVPDLRKKTNPETGKKKKENARMCPVAKTIPKVRNTPKFNALSTEEKDIFFRTLKEARDSVVKKNPEKNMEILPLSAIMRKYRGDREATSVFTTAQELRKGEEGRKNLRVKVTLTSGDNERLSKTKSQVLSDAVREASDRRHKSAESLHAEGKEPGGKNEIQSESSLWNVGKTNKPSRESRENNTSTLENGKKAKTTVRKEQDKNFKEPTKPQVKKKKKAAGKEEKLSRLASSSVIIEPKITDSMKVNISNSSLGNEKKTAIKALKKDAAALGKKRTKTEKQKKKKIRKKEEYQKEKELNTGSFFPCNVARNRDPEKKGPHDWELTAEVNSICEEEQSQNIKKKEIKEVSAMVEEEEEASTIDENNCGSLEGFLTEIAHSVSNLSSIAETLEEMSLSVLDDDKVCDEEEEEEEEEKEDHRLISANLKEITIEASSQREIFEGESFLKGPPTKEEKTVETATEFPTGKVMMMDDNVVEKIRKLIYYLEAKVQKDGHLEKEYLQLVVDYIDYLSKVLESLVLREERNHKQVHDTYTAAEVHLKFEDRSTREEKKETSESKREFFPRSISDQDFRKEYSVPSEKTKEQTSKEKSPYEKPDEVLDSESLTDSEGETRFTPIYSDEKKVLSTKIRLLQDLLKQRAEFVEGSIEDFKIVHHPEAEDLVPVEKPPTVQILADEDEEDMQQENKKKFFKTLLRCCACGKKKTDEDGIFENLKGEAVRVEMYEEKKIDPASATLNESTMEVLKATERKKIIEKYYNQD